ncbi:MAG: metallophosphoesterase [Imperialibacter sp.]|uniref:metallophosphoesterase family protein n=1 Tax=Imperialibacter sp. TaxID=2038411 RepID=UPI0032ED634D
MDFKRVIVLLLLAAFGCRQQDSIISPTYSSFPISDSSRQAVSQLWKGRKEPAIPALYSLDSNWLYVQGADEQLISFKVPSWQNAQPLRLPHRITLPNTAMWYRKILPAAVPPSVLMVNADDGAQVFLNGNKLQRHWGEGNFLFEGDKGDTLVIRVLNNAMAGGLRNVNHVDRALYIDFEKKLTLFRNIDNLVKQAERIQHPPSGFFEKVTQALENPSDSLYEKAATLLSSFPLLSSPVLLQDQQSYTLRWLSTMPGDAMLFTGPSPDQLTNQHNVSSATPLFTVSLSELGDDRFYRIGHSSTWTKIFEIPVLDSEVDSIGFSFTLWADSQGGWQVFSELMDDTNSFSDVFSVGAGDLVSNGSDSLQWKDLLTSLGQANGRFPFFLVPGNHDYDGYYDDLQPKNFNQYVTTPSGKNYFSWQYANCAFIALDPNEAFPIGFDSSDQKQWLLSEIESAEWKAATWHFVILHQPPLSQGWPGYHGDEVVRELLDSVYESANIDFVVAGHTHDYERLTRNYGNQQVNFLIVGGAGGGLEPEDDKSEYPVMDRLIRKHHLARMFVHGDSIHLEVKDLNQNMIDQFDFIKQ